jgi:hypothetical protein
VLNNVTESLSLGRNRIGRHDVIGSDVMIVVSRHGHSERELTHIRAQSDSLK